MTKKQELTFNDAINSYRSYLHSNGKLTKNTYQRLVRFGRELGDIKLSDVTAMSIRQFVESNYKGRTGATINRNLNIISAILNYAYECGMLDNKVRIRRGKVRALRNQHLELEEIMPVVNFVRVKYGPFAGFLMLLLVDTGVRLGEALNMRWCDIRPQWTYVRNSTYEHSKTVVRMVPTSPRMVEYMKKYGILPDKFDKPLDRIVKKYWYDKTDRAIGYTMNMYLREAVVTLSCQCGYDIKLHDLRHTFAYMCAMAGADLGDIKEMMGHTSINVTMRYRGFVKTKAIEAIRLAMQKQQEELENDTTTNEEGTNAGQSESGFGADTFPQLADSVAGRDEGGGGQV